MLQERTIPTLDSRNAALALRAIFPLRRRALARFVPWARSANLATPLAHPAQQGNISPMQDKVRALLPQQAITLPPRAPPRTPPALQDNFSPIKAPSTVSLARRGPTPTRWESRCASLVLKVTFSLRLGKLCVRRAQWVPLRVGKGTLTAPIAQLEVSNLALQLEVAMLVPQARPRVPLAPPRVPLALLDSTLLMVPPRACPVPLACTWGPR